MQKKRGRERAYVAVINKFNAVFVGNVGMVNASNCTIHGNVDIVNGSNCIVYGDVGTVNGNNCTVYGRACTVNGSNCRVSGSILVINGSNFSKIARKDGDASRISDAAIDYLHADYASGQIRGGIRSSIVTQSSVGVPFCRITCGDEAIRIYGIRPSLLTSFAYSFHAQGVTFGAKDGIAYNEHGRVAIMDFATKNGDHYDVDFDTIAAALRSMNDSKVGAKTDVKELNPEDDEAVDDEEEGAANACCVCLERKKIVAPDTCMHLCMCIACSSEVKKRCPMCRAEFTKAVRVFT